MEIKKFQLSKGLTRREAFGELLKHTMKLSAFTYDIETGIVVVEPPLVRPTFSERIFKFRSASPIEFEDVSGAPIIEP